MKISVELTLMPLHENYETPIEEFIKALRASEFTVLENPLSTQIYGDYDGVMAFLTQAVKTSFQDQEHIIVNMKIVKSDRSNYEPHF
ncbi:YkoF family thiamine/hydroxymethylpyrimidine-binding protein [Formosa haliotis]|uniref:YkoF family thiamine/hydroxymethylpyrimidine-binding protein n=1 Tax=Formosa haliotis TaxID=1555194 RepID=UPI000825242E|nr:YkoF family thiamine/hydroxymethylpyrimidine-binding protein [Formosa haliotis]